MSPFDVVFPGNKKIDVTFKNFVIKTDQSKEDGGDESAPNPFTLFLAALGSCAGVYAKSFCDTRDLDTTDMKLELDYKFKEGEKMLEKVSIILHVNQAFPEKYVKAVIKAMAGCTVKKQLNPEIIIDTQVAYLPA